jgi:uncharacterized protein (DUF983 family)
MARRAPILLVLSRGLRRRCPRCGEGALFRRWIESNKRCSVCGVLYQRNYGDTWAFIIITDRIPILAGIVAIYFGYESTGWLGATLFFLALVVPLLATIPQRQGLAIALDYLSRIYLPDPSDEIHDGREYVIAPNGRQ